VGRIGLQDQRVARARELLERIQNELGSAEQERTNMQTALRELTRSVEQQGDDARRADLERELRLLKERMAVHGRATAALQARQAEAAQALETESARYDELDGWLRSVDQELRRPAR
jgi:chromosome segregation ATPase